MFQSETYFFEQPERTQQADDPTLDFGIKRYVSYFSKTTTTPPFYCVKEPRVSKVLISSPVSGGETIIDAM